LGSYGKTFMLLKNPQNKFITYFPYQRWTTLEIENTKNTLLQNLAATSTYFTEQYILLL
jgi:hypothetical protein